MQHTLTCPPENFIIETDPALNVLIAYEDFETGKHAKRTYDFLVENIGRDCRFTNQMWKFDVLLLPKLRDIAIEDAVRADIIIISSQGRELPQHVKLWMESWLPLVEGTLALVALFDDTREETAQRNLTRNYLADVARRGGMEFFAQPDVWPRGLSTETLSSTPGESRPNARALSTLAGVVQRSAPSSRWTMNE